MQLEEVFHIASDYARGKIDRVTVEDGKKRPLTIVERQHWARIAAYAVQIINNIAKGIDERQINLGLDKLEACSIKQQRGSLEYCRHFVHMFQYVGYWRDKVEIEI